VQAADFEDVSVEEVPIEYRFESWDDYRHTITSLAASLRELLSTLDDRAKAEIDAAAKARLDRFRGDDGYVLPGVALVTRARGNERGSAFT
jgi:hypothetical protein